MLPGYRYLSCEAEYWPFSEWRQNDNTRGIQYFLEILISEDKDNYYGRVHCNDEPKQNPSLSTQPLYFIAGLSESL
jgi:hypothetical protein